MKITVEFDCTPEEARAFLGLPDVRPLQAAVMARMERQMLDAATLPESLLRAWLPLMSWSPEQAQAAMAALFGAATRRPPTPGGKS